MLRPMLPRRRFRAPHRRGRRPEPRLAAPALAATLHHDPAGVFGVEREPADSLEFLPFTSREIHQHELRGGRVRRAPRRVGRGADPRPPRPARAVGRLRRRHDQAEPSGIAGDRDRAAAAASGNPGLARILCRAAHHHCHVAIGGSHHVREPLSVVRQHVLPDRVPVFQVDRRNELAAPGRRGLRRIDDLCLRREARTALPLRG